MTLAPVPFDLGQLRSTPVELTPDDILDIAGRVTHMLLPRWQFSHDDREDARQVAALAVWQASQRYTDRGSGYYVIVARHAVARWLGGRRKSNARPMDESIERRLASSQVEPDERAHMRERIDELHLSDREATFLRYRLDGNGLAAIASHMGITYKTAEGIQRHLLKHLRQRAGEPLPPPRVEQPSSGSTAARDELCRRIVPLRAEGRSWSQIGEHLQLTERMARSLYLRWLKGVPSVSRTAEERRELCECMEALRAEGVVWREVAAQLQMTERAAKSLYQRWQERQQISVERT